MAEIKVTNLKYKYPQTTELALNGLSFEIKAGEFIGIIGENNSGKSTLCQAFVGLVPNFYRGAFGGSVVIENTKSGKSINVAKTPVSKTCQTVGLVFQNPFNQLTGAKETVFEEVAYGLQNFGIPKEEIIRRVNYVLELLDISAYKDRHPFDLSGGQMQRVAIASILAMEPEVIVLDEPTSQLDPQGSEEVFSAVDKLTKAGIIVIMVEHKMEKIAKYSDRVMLLHQGKLIDFDTPQKVFSRDDLEQYGVSAPAFTQICKKLGKKLPNGLYPVTLEEAQGLLKADASRTFASKEVDSILYQEVLKAQGLNFHYTEGTPILKDVNLTIDGRTTAIIGQNGAGKTTLVKLYKGLLKPVQGTISFMGEDIAKSTVASLASKVGFVFQNPNDQIFKTTVIDEVMFGPLQIGMKPEVAKKKAMEALELVQLTKYAKENPYDMGLSQRKFVAIASILAMDTQVLILDEPTIAQDYKGKEILKNIINKLRSEGKTVITIIHDMDFVAECFERTIVFAKGQVLADGDTREVFAKKEVLEKAYLEQPHITQLCQNLGAKEVCLTVDEAVEVF